MRNEALAHCDGRLCDAQGLSSAATARWYAAVSTGTLIGGLVSIGIASYVLVLRSDGPTSEVKVGISASPAQGQIVVAGSL
jgi:hypothetical protein